MMFDLSLADRAALAAKGPVSRRDCDVKSLLRIPLPGSGGGGHLDLPLTHESREALLADLEVSLDRGEGFALATVNLDHTVKLRCSDAFRKAYLRHTHIVADGNPIVWLSRLSGRPVSLTPGSELIEPLAALAARTGVPVGFFGSNEATLAKASEELRARYPGLRTECCIAPSQDFDPGGTEARRFIEEMAQNRARIWFLALGAPKQELFAARARRALPGRGFVSIGAGLDFLAGDQIRAPKLVRRLAMEWAWRMAGNPFRLAPRYARCAALLPKLALAAYLQRTASNAPARAAEGGRQGSRLA